MVEWFGRNTMAKSRTARRKRSHDGAKQTPTYFDCETITPAVILSTVTWCVLRYAVQPLFGPDEYYIDEEFHVPQARRYCQAQFNKVSITLKCENMYLEVNKSRI